MRQGHPLADAPLTLDTYCAARHMLVSFSGRPFGFIDEALASLGRERKVVITVNQFFTAGRVVSGSDLLTVLPRHFVPVTGIADALVQRALPLDVPAVHVDALWRRRGPQQAAMTWLLQAPCAVSTAHLSGAGPALHALDCTADEYPAFVRPAPGGTPPLCARAGPWRRCAGAGGRRGLLPAGLATGRRRLRPGPVFAIVPICRLADPRAVCARQPRVRRPGLRCRPPAAAPDL